jgi:hypothetical protein
MCLPWTLCWCSKEDKRNSHTIRGPHHKDFVLHWPLPDPDNPTKRITPPTDLYFRMLTNRLQPLQIAAQFRGGLVSQRAILLDKLASDALELGRDLGFRSRTDWGVLLQESFEDDRGCRAVDRPRLRHHLVQTHAE